MTDETNNRLRHFAKNLSPTEKEKELISKVYDAIRDCLDEGKCLQIGSYPRYTSITPIHDLDILYNIGKWGAYDLTNANSVIHSVHSRLESGFRNPTNYSPRMSEQSHSVTISFRNAIDEECFSVDIVPAFEDGHNEFNLPMYRVPEIAHIKHSERAARSWNPLRQDSWIKSDPRGYIECAKRTNNANDDFRRTVKIVKFWKNTIRDSRPDIKLKSFHLEQVILDFFRAKPTSLTISEALFQFLFNIPAIIDRPQIKDRARPDVYIDGYISDLTSGQKGIIIAVRDSFLKKLEDGFS
ncbi:hypothetical protein IJI72_01535 [Candidatus Saccharibacteria bacterium]|nr:hypothetical protein [Candidatus Saccharibacteria bacterium]